MNKQTSCLSCGWDKMEATSPDPQELRCPVCKFEGHVEHFPLKLQTEELKKECRIKKTKLTLTKSAPIDYCRLRMEILEDGIYEGVLENDMPLRKELFE